IKRYYGQRAGLPSFLTGYIMKFDLFYDRIINQMEREVQKDKRLKATKWRTKNFTELERHIHLHIDNGNKRNISKNQLSMLIESMKESPKD
ncbi:MAG: hypothetical protein ACRC0R_05235, partial [Cetobacterium sp.]